MMLEMGNGFGDEKGEMREVEMRIEIRNEKLEVRKKTIKTYKDLDVYNRSLEAAKRVLLCVIPRLPVTEKYDLADQLRRCCKAIPALIAEGYAKKHQPRAFQKYLEDSLGESNEMNAHLIFCRDVYCVDQTLCDGLLESYEIIGKQLYCLRRNWTNFGKEVR